MNVSSPEMISTMAKSPAFPVPQGANGGVELRDWIAAMALNGLAARGLDVIADRALTKEDKDLLMASQAYGLADAMLVARLEGNAVD